MFNVVFLPLHLGGHFVFGGANLRQILDYGMMVKNSAEDSIDWNKVREFAVKAGSSDFSVVSMEYALITLAFHQIVSRTGAEMLNWRKRCLKISSMPNMSMRVH